MSKVSIYDLLMSLAGYVTTGEAARLLGVGLNTVKRWIANGDLKGIQTPGGHWRIPKADLECFMQKRGMKSAEQDRLSRILIVDDEPHICTFLKEVLEHARLPLEFKCEHDGYAGLIQIGSWRPDILILDIFMPAIDGIEVLRRLRQDPDLAGDMKIIVVTAAFDRPVIKQAISDVRPDVVLPKPVDTLQLLDAVERCLEPKHLRLSVA